MFLNYTEEGVLTPKSPRLATCVRLIYTIQQIKLQTNGVWYNRIYLPYVYLYF